MADKVNVKIFNSAGEVDKVGARALNNANPSPTYTADEIASLPSYNNIAQISYLLNGNTTYPMIEIVGGVGRYATSKLKDVADKLYDAETNLESVDGRLTTAESNITSVDSRLTTAESNIDNIQSAGSIEFVNNATTTTATSNVYTKALGNTYFDGTNEFEMTQNNRLTYTGTANIKKYLFVNGEALGDGGSAYELTITVFKNGTQLLRTLKDINGVDVANQPIERNILVNSSTVEDFSLIIPIELTQNDYFEIYIKTANNHTPSIKNANLTIK